MSLYAGRCKKGETLAPLQTRILLQFQAFFPRSGGAELDGFLIPLQLLVLLTATHVSGTSRLNTEAVSSLQE